MARRGEPKTSVRTRAIAHLTPEEGRMHPIVMWTRAGRDRSNSRKVENFKIFGLLTIIFKSRKIEKLSTPLDVMTIV